MDQKTGLELQGVKPVDQKTGLELQGVKPVDQNAGLELERVKPVDQKTPTLRYIAEHPDLFSRQGSVVAAYRKAGPRTYGPYYRLSYRVEGRQRSVYLGRDPQQADAVRSALANLQNQRRRQREFAKLERDVRRSLRLAKIQANLHIRLLGLRFHGFEIRGWRRNPIFTAIPWRTPRSPQPLPLALRFQRRLKRLKPICRAAEIAMGVQIETSPRGNEESPLRRRFHAKAKNRKNAKTKEARE